MDTYSGLDIFSLFEHREERDRNRRLREEQDAAYQATLIADQERVGIRVERNRFQITPRSTTIHL